MTKKEQQEIISELQRILDENGKDVLSSPNVLLTKLDACGKISAKNKFQIRNAAELGILTRFCGAKAADYTRIREKAIKDICDGYGTANDVVEEIVTIAQALQFKTEPAGKPNVDHDSEPRKIAEVFGQIYTLKGREIYKERDKFVSMFKDLYPECTPKSCRLIKNAMECGAFAMIIEINGNDESVCATATQKMVYEYGIDETIAADVVKSIAWSVGKNPVPSASETTSTDDQNSPELYNRGMDFFVRKEYAEAIKILKPLAEKGNAYTCYKVGECYDGLHEYVEAVKWYRKAAEQGNAVAQYQLGNIYYYGHGVSKDEAEAVKWYKKSAEQGNAKAQYRLGYAHDYGFGVTQNDAEAVKWYQKAAEQGNDDAQWNLGFAYEFGRGVAQNYVEAVKWYKKSAEQGNAVAQYRLGYVNEYGRGVAQNYAEAVKWYQKAAEQGNAKAQYCLGYAYEFGRGVKPDYTESRKWYQKSADQGDPKAQYRLGCAYEYGLGVAQDNAEAVKWYQKSADQGNAWGEYHLGKCFKYGRGVPKDSNEAKAWLQKAANRGNKEARLELAQ